MKDNKIYKAVRLTPTQIELITNQANKLEMNFSQTLRVIIDKYYKK